MDTAVQFLMIEQLLKYFEYAPLTSWLQQPETEITLKSTLNTESTVERL